MTRPEFGSGIVQFPGQTAKEFAYPFVQRNAPKAKFVLRETIELSAFYPTIFEIYPRSVLWTIKVNGQEIMAKGLPLSSAIQEGRAFDLAPFLHPGANLIELNMEVFGKDAALQACVSPWDKYSLLLSTLILLATVGTAAFGGLLLRINILRPEMLIVFGGFLLRYAYFFGTPYFVRAYDYWGHVDYLDYVVQHLSLPDSHSNWEAYQPPLYYLLVGGMTKLFLLCGMVEGQRFIFWQGFSLLCSTGVLVAGLWIGRLLYPNEVKYRLYLLAVLSVAPALVFNSSRVSNDVLLILLDFFWIGFLLEFWQRPEKRAWFGLSVILGLALLTKASALALIPISLLCLCLTPQWGLRSKAYATLTLLVVSCGIAGWYYVPRAFHETAINTYVVGNLHALYPKAHIDGVLGKSLVFNPLKVLRYPVADPWGPHHDYFLEFFFKTIFFGEWIRGASYKWVARAFILTAMFLIPAFIWGTYCALKKQSLNTLPLVCVLFGLFAAHWIFVQFAPYVSSQDFRYSVVLLIPFVVLFLQGAANLPEKVAHIARFFLQLLILNSAIYLTELAWRY